jgi:hypothetical protein
LTSAPQQYAKTGSRLHATPKPKELGNRPELLSDLAMRTMSIFHAAEFKPLICIDIFLVTFKDGRQM